MTATKQYMKGFPFLYSNHYQQSIAAHVVFGEPSNNCRGSGICKVFVVPFTHSAKLCNCPNQLTGELWYEHKHKMLFFRFDRSTIPAHLNERLFNNPTFDLFEDWLATEDLNACLGIDNLVLPKGTYPLIKTAKYIEILFSI